MKAMLKLAITLACLTLFASAASAQTFVRMVSGPSGGSWYPLGAKIMQVLGEEVKGISTSNGPGGGVSNIKDVNSKNAEIGWSYGHTAYNGYVGRGKFNKAQKDVRFFATLYPAAFQVAVKKDSPIKSFADMKDKNLSPGKSGWTGTAFAETILMAHGFSFKDVQANGGTVHFVDYSNSVALMKDGHIDVFMAVTSVPQASLIDLNFNPGIRFIGLEPKMLVKILNDNPGFIKGVIPKTAYKDLPADVPTLGAATVMVVNKDLSPDLVYNLCKSFWKNHGEFAKVKKIWNDVDVKAALDAAAIPVHPGAEKCYAEMGIKKN